jgi:pimeloyl-ACP methyl ester carboxylesterase
MFLRLHRDLERIQAFGWIEGQAIAADPACPLIVVLYTEPEHRIVDFFVLPRSGRYFFMAAPGTYRIAAFEDRNRDFTYQPGIERAGSYGAPTSIAIEAGVRSPGMNVAIVPDTQWRIPLAIGPLDPHHRGIADLPDVQLGTVVKLADDRFSDANGKLGLWQPAEFVFKIGAGVYFLEPYDSDKTPVLFIHGVTGHPANFTYLVEHLDRKQFQPWFAYYPSGIGLDDVGRVLARWLAALQAEHGFTKIILVAHSMGGLVTRALVNDVYDDPEAKRLVAIEALVTISTPFGGHASAASGVENAPVVIPSWKDMVPGSKFLTDLTAGELPPECEHDLFFSYQGSTPFIREASDGVVSVASELPLVVQQRAKRVLGFSEDHMSILRSADVSAELNAVLARATDK